MTPQKHLVVTVCASPSEAIQQGHFYREPVYKGAQLEKVVVVRKGTTSGKSTVDLVFRDSGGQLHVVMLTAALLRSIPMDEQK